MGGEPILFSKEGGGVPVSNQKGQCRAQLIAALVARDCPAAYKFQGLWQEPEDTIDGVVVLACCWSTRAESGRRKRTLCRPVILSLP